MNKRQFNELKKEWLGVELDLDGVNYEVDRITNRGELGVVDEDGNQMIIAIEDVYFLDEDDNIEFDGEAVEELVENVLEVVGKLTEDPQANHPELTTSETAPFNVPQEDGDPYVDNEDEGDITPPKKRKKTSKTD